MSKNTPPITFSFAYYAGPEGDLPHHLREALGAAAFLAKEAESLNQFVPMRDPARSKLIITSVTALREKRKHAAEAIRGAAGLLQCTRERPYSDGPITAPTAHEAAIAYQRLVLDAIWSGADWERWARCHIDRNARMDPGILRKRAALRGAADCLEKAGVPSAKLIIAEAKIEAAKARFLSPAAGGRERDNPPDAPPTARAAVLEVLGDGKARRYTEIASEAGYAENTVRKILFLLKREGEVTNDRRTGYRRIKR
jgi:hypothetical protein